MEWHRAFTAKHKKEHVIFPVITILIGILLTFIIAMIDIFVGIAAGGCVGPKSPRWGRARWCAWDCTGRTFS